MVIPKALRKELNIERDVVIEVEEGDDGLLLGPINPIAEMRGLGKGIFGNQVEYQKSFEKSGKFHENSS